MSIVQALCSSVALPDGGVPDWLHLLPAGEVRTNDGRGPYRASDLFALAATSISAGKLCVDENHATDLAAPNGAPAPARGWIVELQARENGIWGRVQWTPAGRKLMEAGEYRGVSPVIAHRKDGTITAILRASLTNTPNLTGLESLHSADPAVEHRQAMKAQLIKTLGLSNPSDDTIVTKVRLGLAASQDEARRRTFRAEVVEVLGLGGVTDEMIIAKVRQALLPSHTPFADILTDKKALQSTLSEADRRVISLMGIDPIAYARSLGSDAAEAEAVSRHSAATGGALSAADMRVVKLMGLDLGAYLAGKNCR